nr:MAG TPA: hypothetical protein [Caudoviricetes sp.]
MESNRIINKLFGQLVFSDFLPEFLGWLYL